MGPKRVVLGQDFRMNELTEAEWRAQDEFVKKTSTQMLCYSIVLYTTKSAGSTIVYRVLVHVYYFHTYTRA